MKIVFMSGYAEDVIVKRGLIPEGMAFLQKPFSPRVLGEEIRRALDG